LGKKILSWRLASQLFVGLLTIGGLPSAWGSDSDILRVGLTGKYPPFNYFDDRGQLGGFDVEVAEALCHRIEKKCEYKVLAWDGILAALLSGKIDAVIGSMAITDARTDQANFTAPYYESGAQLFVRSRSLDPKTAGFRIGVTLGTTYGDFARKAYPDAIIKTFKGEPSIYQDLEAGRLDGMVTDSLVGSYINLKRGGRLEALGPLLFKERIGIPVRKDREQLLGALNTALADFRKTAEYRELNERYFGARSSAVSLSTERGASRFDWGHSLVLMIRGLGKTIQVSVLGLLFGTGIALVLATFMTLSWTGIRIPTIIFVDFIRSTPFMIQLFGIYFGLPSIGITLSAWNAAVLAIAIHFSAYFAEILKVAYLGVPAGQRLAARVLGLNRFQALRYVIFPQMAPLLFAPALNTLVAMIKDSAIVSMISVHELTLQAQQLISATFRPIEFYAIAAVLYATITYPMLMVGRWLEKRYQSQGLLHGNS
jgi:His/Glu/Gln/Arg/opine family amino acid ABC transporter permease subunit